MTSVVGARALRADPEICRGCDMCVLACSLEHEDQCNPSLARLRVSKDLERYRFTITICRHCEEPACLVACPVEGAMERDENGVVSIIQDWCVRCGSCAAACPYDAIFFNDGQGIYLKCDLCRSREGGPVCAEVCPNCAITVVCAKGGEE